MTEDSKAPEGEPEAAEPVAGSAEAEARADVKVEADAKARADAKAEAEAEAKANPKAEPKAEPTAEKPAAKIEVQAKAAAKPAAKVPVVEFDHVTKTYGDGPAAFTAIEDISFRVDDRPDHGEFVTMLGPSGSGKSTILRLIAGLEPQHPPTRGRVLVDGKPVAGPGADRGMVFQDYTSFDHRTVLENVAFGLECRGVARKEREALALEWIGKVGLDKRTDAHKYPHQLSGGMRQRVAIARTLVLQPRIILMDEPFGALDPSTRMHMQNLLVALWRELQATVFFITHSIEEAVFLGDRIYLLSSSPGRLLREIVVPPADKPAKDMQREPKFLEYVFDIRDTIENLEASKRAGDD
jgi:NitT/TauT family transport system ATP-binding protein